MEKTVKEELIKQLATGEFVSGQQLGDVLGISRAAISKHIKAVSEMGLDVFRVTGKGYKLAQPLELLNADKISAELIKCDLTNKIEVHNIIDSTNDSLMRRLPNQVEQGQVCVAEYQSAGRGRRGRQWISPFGSHIYLSMYWCLEQGMSAAMGLNIVAALAVSDAVKAAFDIDVQLKWPNDIYLDGVKLAGILIDLDGQALDPCHCVIGIGLNLKMPTDSAKQVDQPWTDISQHTNKDINRNKLVVELIKSLTCRVKQHQGDAQTNIVAEWQQLDYYFDKPVKLISGERIVRGICRGIDHQGALLLDIGGEVKPMYGGELSLRGDT
ncbi:bifunctional biotin--[acetyl-CoA-carboxylase] ligase/biotin operon repressor BirA [Thalassotalea sp. PLHSN55]|uniref:bifunctional biotin--[acetyl-CoA-carboxylase] ligase/biotin operon repressor BirA n=1 Tax=Thalassotalea sp. PLHSN55 TaxID=3435888 RepID=UPI003F82C645